MEQPKFKFPKTIAACGDKAYELRIKRLAMQKEVDAIEAEEKALKEHIIQTLPKSEATGVAGRVARATVVTKEVPQVEDWEAFYKHVKKTGEFDLLNRALNKSAVEERWDHGKKVPGVKAFTAVSVSLAKV